jgi:small subunit ribosomal protein S27
LTRRDYLTASYKLNQEWAERLQTPILQKIDSENLYYEIDAKFNQQKKLSPVDVDIFANKVQDDRHMEEIADLMMKLRTTKEATNVFDSSQHALIRNYIENNNLDSLVYILNHRQEYGVFLDYFSANMLLDKLIEEKKFKLGARFATFLALQEEFANPITTCMSLYTCYKFLGNLETFDDLMEKVVEEEAPKEAPKGKKKKEEIKVRVRYIINDFFDDNFDLKNTNHLLGKTFLLLANEVQSSNETLSDSLKLLGYSLYEKFDEGNAFLAKAKGKSFFKEPIDIVKSLAEKIEDLESKEPAKKFFESVGSLTLKEEKVDELIEGLMKNAIQQNESKDIEEQKKIYNAWNVEREQKLNDEMYRFNRIQRLMTAEKLTDDIEKEERKLWFFENEDKLDLAIEDQKVFYPKRWFGKKKKPRVVDENYIPPDVDRRRN